MALDVACKCLEISVLIAFLYSIVQKIQCERITDKCFSVLADYEIEKIVISKIAGRRFKIEFLEKNQPESKGVDLNESR